MKWSNRQRSAAGRSQSSGVTQQTRYKTWAMVLLQTRAARTAMTACCFVLKGPGIAAELPRVFRSLFMHHERQHEPCQEVPRLVTDCKPPSRGAFQEKRQSSWFREGQEGRKRGEYARDTAVILGKHANPESSPSRARRTEAASPLEPRTWLTWQGTATPHLQCSQWLFGFIFKWQSGGWAQISDQEGNQ